MPILLVIPPIDEILIQDIPAYNEEEYTELLDAYLVDELDENPYNIERGLSECNLPYIQETKFLISVALERLTADRKIFKRFLDSYSSSSFTIANDIYFIVDRISTNTHFKADPFQILIHEITWAAISAKEFYKARRTADGKLVPSRAIYQQLINKLMN